MSYDFGQSPLLVSSQNKLGANDTVKVDIDAVALGDQIIMVRSVSIPS